MNAGGAPQTDAVRTGDCGMSGQRTRTTRRDQALRALRPTGNGGWVKERGWGACIARRRIGPWRSQGD
ncbi:DUF6233 domain-containing protein [Streptomyces sp. NBC_00842]|uniref:DUF6233 domain-containing protein n=1 Tax=unclassified Streptomyces TaxID=2593676 RepID=UPI00386BB4E0